MALALYSNELPPLLQTISEQIGLAATLRLVELYGGSDLFVPKRFDKEHALVAAIGMEACEQLSLSYDSTTLYIPRCVRAIRAARDYEINERYLNEQIDQRQLAKMYELTVRQIRTIVNSPASLLRTQAPDAQLALF